MIESVDEDEVLRLGVTSVTPLVPGSDAKVLLGRRDRFAAWPKRSLAPAAASLLGSLGGGDGRLDMASGRWSYGYGLRAAAGLLGYLLIDAPAEPSADQHFLLTVLAQQMGTALGNVRSSRKLAELNQRLRATLRELDRVTSASERLMRAAAAGQGELGIARACTSW